MVLADEINRTPPKTQAALLEAMQEHHVTAGAQTYHLPEPFFVLATQNPIEQEGTYPLPEAQLDRFMFNIIVGYPSRGEEIDIMKRTTSNVKATLEPMLSGEQIMRLQEVVRQVVVADHVFSYAADLVRRDPAEGAGRAEVHSGAAFVGSGAACLPVPDPRRQGAALAQRPAARRRPKTSRRSPIPVLRHRLVTTFHADAEGITTDDVIKKLIDHVPLPQEKAAAKVRA